MRERADDVPLSRIQTCARGALLKLLISKLHIAFRVHFSTSVSECNVMQFYAHEGLPLKSCGCSVFLYLFLPVTQAVSIPFCTTLDLKLSFYRPLCYE
jgi:hypothetical protein